MLATRLKAFASASSISFVLAAALSSLAQAQTYKVLYSFTGGTDGGGVWSGVAMDKQGNLYGTTSGGGAYGYGTVFELSPNADGTWTETVLHSFMNNDAQGYDPMSSLTLDAAGNLYGTAWGGGAYKAGGTVFELTPSGSGWSLTAIHSFGGSSSDGFEPYTGLTFGKSGSLYGTTSNGGPSSGGTAFKLTPGSSGWTETVLFSFGNNTSSGGSVPSSGLTLDAKGNLYGVASAGGSNAVGVVFELYRTNTWTESVLHQFGSSQSDGAEPGGNLIFDAKGSVYGTTLIGGGTGCGSIGCGTVYRLTRGSGGWKESLLTKFGNGANGNGPVGGVIFDIAGNLYGVTSSGGAGCGCGVVYKLTPSPVGAWKYTVLHAFTGTDGAQPTAGLILDSAGNLYGTTVVGGTAGYGVVFEITP